MRQYTVCVLACGQWYQHADGRREPIVERECGHRHRTINGAARCLRTLIAYNPRSRMWSAAWHRGEVLGIGTGAPIQLDDDEEQALYAAQA